MGILESQAADVLPFAPAETALQLPPTAAAPPRGSLLARILDEAAQGRYEEAVALSRWPDADHPDVINARGVCYLRMGKIEEAVVLYRRLVLQPGCIWMRRELPVHYKTNFATAILLADHPLGCNELLHELGIPGPPRAQMLRAAIKAWENALPFWPWLNWKTARFEPRGRPVALDFLPGEFGYRSADGMLESQATRRARPA